MTRKSAGIRTVVFVRNLGIMVTAGEFRGFGTVGVVAQRSRFQEFLMKATIVVILSCHGAPTVVEGTKQGVPPVLPSKYQGSGDVLQALLNASWPVAQGPSSTFTFFAPQNKAVKKYTCLLSNSASLAGKQIATTVLRYHIIPGKAWSQQKMRNLAASGDYSAATAFTGHKLNLIKGGLKLNGYSFISDPDIGTKSSQAIHGVSQLLVPPDLIIGCGPPAPAVKGFGNASSADRAVSVLSVQMRYLDVGITFLWMITSLSLQ